ncbi:MAG: tRNA lysidine(34) synthetase TilS, partial [Phycisphaerae bacterium]|nr:tRNA lysidine(34) synthetase TilS [Phycisphaerae bacterium]
MRTIFEFCLSFGLLADCGRLLVAVSGGADSVALLHGLKRLNDDGKINCDIFVGHINHNLRGCDSDGDEEFVKTFAEELGLRCVTRSVDVKGYARENKLSIETAARDLRIKCLMEMADSLDCDRIATAHHADDNAETVIYRMGRGTGFKGLCGIKPENIFKINDRPVRYIRPLLCVTREEIVAYCQKCGIGWRHDHTNDEIDYTRNRIRHLLIPYLQEQSGISLTGKLCELSSSCQKLYERIERKIESHDLLFEQFDCGGVSVDGVALKGQLPIIQAEVIRMALVKVGCGQRDVTRKHYQKIIGLLAGDGGKVIELPGGFTAMLELGKIIFYPPAALADEAVDKQNAVMIKIPGTVDFGGFEIRAEILDAAVCDLGKFIAEKTGNVEWFDMDKIAGAIYARKRKKGDRFIPIGMTGEKKVGKFLTAERVSYQLRRDIVVFEDAKRIIWVGPVRASEETRVDGASRMILCIEMSS